MDEDMHFHHFRHFQHFHHFGHQQFWAGHPGPGPVGFVSPAFGIVPMIILLLTFFWIWMLMDCARNPRLQSGPKVGWLAFIFFTYWLGGLCYFVGERKRNEIYAYQPQPQRMIAYSRPKEHEMDQEYESVREVYREYEQGYQPEETCQETQPAISRHDWQRYEEPQTNYPEPPQQEMQQQNG